MGILSVQSQVVSGFVGNSAAAFALQRLGREVWAVPSVLLSHHPGHGGTQGGPLPAALLASLLAGLETRGCLARCAAVVSGYLGHADAAGVVEHAVMRARAAGGRPIYLCDPVLGDDGRPYVSPDVVTATHNLAHLADIITPNAYELSRLAGQNFATRAAAWRAMRDLQSRGPQIVILSSFCGTDTPPGTIDVLALDGPAAWRLSLPRLTQKFSGPGDLLAALFLHFWLPAQATGMALGQACSALFGVLAATAAVGADELLLIEAQDQLVAPARRFHAEPVV